MPCLRGKRPSTTAPSRRAMTSRHLTQAPVIHGYASGIADAFAQPRSRAARRTRHPPLQSSIEVRSIPSMRSFDCGGTYALMHRSKNHDHSNTSSARSSSAEWVHLSHLQPTVSLQRRSLLPCAICRPMRSNKRCAAQSCVTPDADVERCPLDEDGSLVDHVCCRTYRVGVRAL